MHGISYSTAEGAKLDLPLLDVTWEEFTDAIRVGAFSLVEISGGLLDVFKDDASILAVTLRWSKVAVPRFNVVSATKAALESIIRGLAQSLGNASPRLLEIDHRMGGMSVDLRGSWVRDAQVRITQRMGGGEVRLPEGVEIEGLSLRRIGRARAGQGSPEVPMPKLDMSVSSVFGKLDVIE